MYEPERGCYIGADISGDKTISANISDFEEKTLKPHALYANSMKLGEAYPYEWILECISKQKTPVLTIVPPDAPSPFQDDLLEKTAKEAGELNIPMFVQFYPYSSEEGYKPERYVDFFRKAHTLFKKYAPHIAMIWGVSAENVYDCFSYYPGDSCVDWAGIIIAQKIGDFDGMLYRPVMNDIDYFYYSFQKKKPIMISGLSVSHYSTETVQYYTNEAAAEINKIYKTVADRYPRIKAVIYKSYNEIDQKETAVPSGIYNNYLLEDEAFVLESYCDGINRERYQSEFNPAKNGNTKYDFIRSPFSVYANGEGYFISDKSLQYDLGLVGLSLLAESEVFINGGKYYPLDALEKHLSFKFDIDEVKEILILEKV
jgi:hypothetical protein